VPRAHAGGLDPRAGRVLAFNGTLDGNVFVFFILTVAAAEVAVGLAIIVALFRKRQTVQVDELNNSNTETLEELTKPSARAAGCLSSHSLPAISP
jgi:hypothetical protein